MSNQIMQSYWANFEYCRWKLHNLTRTNMYQKYNLVWLQCMSWFQIMWARQLEGANTSYQILTIGEATHINDNRFLIPKSTVNNVRRYSHRKDYVLEEVLRGQQIKLNLYFILLWIMSFFPWTITVYSLQKTRNFDWKRIFLIKQVCI